MLFQLLRSMLQSLFYLLLTLTANKLACLSMTRIDQANRLLEKANAQSNICRHGCRIILNTKVLSANIRLDRKRLACKNSLAYNLQRKMFFNIDTSGNDLIKHFGLIYIYSFLLARSFQNSVTYFGKYIKWQSLKSVIKFMPKQFYEIDPWIQLTTLGSFVFLSTGTKVLKLSGITTP